MTRTLLASLLVLTGCFEDDSAGAPPAPFTVNPDGTMTQNDNDGTGSDPTADDDGDGFTNAEDEAAGTNPNYEYSRPYEGGYNVGFCDTPPEATGATGTTSITQGGETYEWPSLAMGDVPNNMTFMDQYGEMVDLYSFCGKHVMVLVSAGWCGPCRGLAEEVQAIQDEWRDDGLQIIELITANNSQGGEPDLAFVQGWAEEYNFDDVPVLAVPRPTAYEHPTYLFDADGYIPSVYHLNEKLEVVSPDQSVHSPSNWL